ncbi:MAG TPA: PaaX family transcriptional regulator C-terminal domain-containing protein [Patescibacteria group bacterium]
MAIKERRTKILLALYLLSGVDFSLVNLDEKTQKIFDLSLNQKTRGTLSGLIKEEMIEKERNVENDQHVGQNRYKLTEKGFGELCLEFPFFRFLKEKWDGKLRIISYEIPEKKREIRDRLRREMQGWGLGPWHRSFWLTPHPILTTLKSLTSQKEEEQYIQAFEADHTFGDRQILIEKVWGKSNLDKSYRELFKKWHEVLSSNDEKIDKFKKVIGEYVNLLRQDPGLPKELIGDNWIGFEGWNIFKEIKSILLS